MESNKKVSVIIPMYNVGAYIEECLQSIVSQSYKKIQVILVDDCSTDNTVELCKEFMPLFKDCMFLSNSENMGAAKSRNIGLENADGEYISFIDADDCVSCDFISELVCAIEKNDADIAQCGITSDIYKINNKILIYEGKEIIKKYLAFKKVNGFFGGKIFRRQVVTNNRMNESLRWGEDGIFVLNCLMQSKKYVILSSNLYRYRIHIGSLSHDTCFREEVFDNLIQGDMVEKICGIDFLDRVQSFEFVLDFRAMKDLIEYHQIENYLTEFRIIYKRLGACGKNAFRYGKLTTKIKAIIWKVLSIELHKYTKLC